MEVENPTAITQKIHSFAFPTCKSSQSCLVNGTYVTPLPRPSIQYTLSSADTLSGWTPSCFRGILFCLLLWVADGAATCRRNRGTAYRGRWERACLSSSSVFLMQMGIVRRQTAGSLGGQTPASAQDQCRWPPCQPC